MYDRFEPRQLTRVVHLGQAFGFVYRNVYDRGPWTIQKDSVLQGNLEWNETTLEQTVSCERH